MENKEKTTEGKKYEILENYGYENAKSKRICRIRALRDFGDVQKGDLGGYVQDEENLSHEGNCWIYDDSHVIDNARVEGDAKVRGSSYLLGNSYVCERAEVSNILMKGNATVKGNVYLDADITIEGDALITKENDICYFGLFGEECQTFTAYRTKDGTVEMTNGEYQGDLEDFKRHIKETYPKGSPLRKTFKAIAKVIKYKFYTENQ